MLQAGIRPSLDRIVQYLKDETNKAKLSLRLQNIRFCIAAMLQNEEANAGTEQGEKWIEDLLRLVESRASEKNFESEIMLLAEANQNQES